MKKLCLIFLVGTIQMGCTQVQVAKNHAPINFLKYAYNPKANVRGLITLEVNYEGVSGGNQVGKALVYRIHKNGATGGCNRQKKASQT